MRHSLLILTHKFSLWSDRFIDLTYCVGHRMLHKQHFSLMNGFVHHIKNTLLGSCFCYFNHSLYVNDSCPSYHIHLRVTIFFIHPLFSASVLASLSLQMHWEVCAAGGLVYCTLAVARRCQWGCRYILLKAWAEATSQVKALHGDVKRHTLTSRKLTVFLDFTPRAEQRRMDGHHSGHFRPPDTSINA